ncbi:MAG: hypothetical protein JWR84_2896 [Caulobacter sp.]|nr:hypothetical protein [Caulobacter sp.]
MTKFTAVHGGNMSTWSLADIAGGAVTVHTATTWTVIGASGTTYTFKGTFSAYDGAFFPTTGTVTSFTAAKGPFADGYVINTFSLGVPALRAFLANDDAAGLQTALFSGADSFTDSNVNDVMLGGDGNDVFVFTAPVGENRGGHDTVDGGSGNDNFLFGANFSEIDSVEGGIGFDRITLAGPYASGVTFLATTMTGVETLSLTAGNSYSLTTHDGNVAAGESLTVAGGTLAAGQVLTFDGSAEVDGVLLVTGGAGDDTLRGGAGNDTLTGGAGNDTLYGDPDTGGGGGPAPGIRMLSVDSAGQQGTGFSFGLAISNDGSKVAFISSSSTLVDGDTNGSFDIFVKDLTTGQVTLVSTSSLGVQQNATAQFNMRVGFSPDGNKVVFTSRSTNLSPNDSVNDLDVFVKDLITGELTLVSTGSGGIGGGGFAYQPSFSPDGTKVIFYSEGQSYVADDNNPTFDVFIKDLTTGVTTRVSEAGNGEPGNFSSVGATFSPDGTRVLFQSQSTNFGAMPDGDFDVDRNIFVKYLSGGGIVQVNTNAGGFTADEDCWQPVWSPDGTKVLFGSTATNLVGGDSNGLYDLFVKDMTTGAVTRVSTATDGTQGNGTSGNLTGGAWSPDGNFIAFESIASNLVAGDTNDSYDVFIKNLTTGELVRVTVNADGVDGNNHSADTIVWAPDGSAVGFGSDASNLVLVDTNAARDVFLVPLASPPVVVGFGNDILNGGDGDDTLWGLRGNDTLNGGAGIDTLYGGEGNDILAGLTGNDLLYGDVGNDSIRAGDGDDVAQGDGGDDSMAGEGGDDLMYGGDGNDGLDGGAGFNTLSGEEGNDTLTIASGFNDVAAGGNGNDIFVAGAALNTNDMVDGGEGEDLLRLTGEYALLVMNATTLVNVETIQLTSGFSYVLYTHDATVAAGTTLTLDAAQLGGAVSVSFSGALETDGSFLLKGGFGADDLSGGAGSDTLQGNTGNDHLNGGGGDDSLRGGIGNDTVHGNAGDDIVLNSDGGSDSLFGDAGLDLFYFGTTLDAADSVDGGDDYDTVNLLGSYLNGMVGALTNVELLKLDGNFSYKLTLSEATVEAGDTLTIDATTLGAGKFLTLLGGLETNGALSVLGSAGADKITAGRWHDYVEGGAGDDVVLGLDGDDDLRGGLGKDNLAGGAGIDDLYGEDGDDILNGGNDADRYFGGLGADRILFNAASHLIGAARIDGGGGTDVVELTGDYSGEVVFEATTLTGVEKILLATGYYYTLVLADGNVAAGQGLIIDGAALGASNKMDIDGSASHSGSFTMLGGAGADTLTGGDGGDVLRGGAGIDLLYGNAGADELDGGAGDDALYGGDGNDLLISTSLGENNMFGGDGDDVVSFTIGYDALDYINSGLGFDTLNLKGAYGTVAMDLFGVELVQVQGAFNYNLVLSDGDVAAGETLTIKAAVTATGGWALTLNGGAELDGNLQVEGNNGQDQLEGGQGDDLMFGNGDADYLSGAGGADVLYGGLGNDVLKGGAGADKLYGGVGNDSFTGSFDADQMFGEGGDDHFYFGFFEGFLLAGNRIDGGTGFDSLTISGDYSAGVVFDPTTLTSIELLTLEFGNNYDLTFADSNIAAGALLTINATDLAGGLSFILRGQAELNGRFTVFGGAANDELHGGSGSDIFDGALGDDILDGGDGNDTLTGGDGENQLYGGAGFDSLTSGNDDDYLDGGAGNDVLNAGGGNDHLLGGADTDTLNGSQGNDVLEGGAGNDKLFGEFDDDELHGGAGADTLDGDQGDDVLFGDSENDVLRGGFGDDVLDGGDGIDTLYGGQGRDTFTGGAGADKFIFFEEDLFPDSPQGHDRIVDFVHSQLDKINLSAIDADIFFGGDQAFSFIGSAAFTGNVAGQLRYTFVGGDTLVSGDTDGDGQANFTIDLTGNLALVAADFVL